jgi:hypothetical protein
MKNVLSALTLAKLTLVYAACTVLWGGTTLAQPAALGGIAGPGDMPLKEQPRPLSEQLGVKLLLEVPMVDLPGINLAQVLTEDAAETSGLVRESVSVPLHFDPAMGRLYEVGQGGWLWVLDVRAPGSYGVRIHFTDFKLPEGGRAIVYDPQIPDNLPADYTGRGPLGSGEFWAWTSWSDTARVEVYLPPEVGAERVNQYFRIDQAMHIYRNPQTGQTGYGSRELACHNDLECYPNWTQAGGGVGRMQFTIGSSGFSCSGAMLNNSGGDLAPYFMTARHCMQDNGQALNSLQVYWFFQRAGCGGAVPSMGSVPRSDRCTYVRTDSARDMSLVMIEGAVPRTLWWAGNDPAAVPDGAGLIGIHHPDGTRKRISFGYKWPGAINCGATGLQSGLPVTWNSGTIEPGSSGSPLFISNGAFVGVASCGFGICPGGSLVDSYYGSWNLGFGSFAPFVNSPGPDDSNENNDTCGAATNLNIYSNGTLYSQYVKVNDPDWYRISVPAFGSCTFRTVFTHADGDIDMRLHDGCGAVLASSTGTANSEVINWTNSTSSPREVYLNAYLYNDTLNIYYLDFSRSGVSAPANNACASAAVIPAGGQGSNASGTTTGATTDGSANCATASADVWYRLSVPCTRTVTLDTETSSFDTVLSVHTGCPGTAANQVMCNDDVFPGYVWSSLSFTANAGQTYYVRLAGYQGAFGSYYLDANYTYASNDLCATPASLPPGSWGFNSCTCETDGPPDDTCLAFGSNQIYRDHWYTYTPTCYGTLELNTIGSGWDTKVAIYANAGNASCPPGPNSAIACNDDISQTDLQSRAAVSCVPGQSYILRVGSFDSNVGQAGTLNIIFTPSNPCIPTGACCTSNTCTILPQADCTASGGTWLGVNTPCQDASSCPPACGSADFNCDGDLGTDGDIEAYFTCLSGDCPSLPCISNGDFDGDGDVGTDADIEAFFRVLSGGAC